MSCDYFNGRRAALSLSFDDARPSQLDCGVPILDEHGVPASFYVSLYNVEARAEDWRLAARRGHEIGNHTLTHPCSGNFAFARKNPLEEYTLARMAEELDEASSEIHRLTGVTPTTFAYPCGQMFVGIGVRRASYVPLVAERFVVGRGYLIETHNDPQRCDLAAAASLGIDRRPWEWIRDMIDAAIEAGGWIILTAHDVGEAGRLTVFPDVLSMLCQYVRSRESELWTATVAAVGAQMRRTQAEREAVAARGAVS